MTTRTDKYPAPRNIDIPEKPLTSLVMAAVAKYPENVALSFFGTAITYRQLDRYIQQAMNVLRSVGVEKGDRVAIMAPNSPQAVIAYQAILRIGAVVSQTNPLYVEREIKEQFNDAGVAVVVTLNLFAPKIKAVMGSTALRKALVFRLEEFMPWPMSWLFQLKLALERRSVPNVVHPDFLNWDELVRSAPGQAEHASVDPLDTALLQYTGGTTGAAKGVALTHRNVLSNALQCRAWFTAAEEGKEVFMLALPMFHAFGMTAGLNLGFSLAGKIVLVPKFEADTVMKLIEKHRATIFPGVPAMYVAINNHPKAPKRNISSIKYCVSGAAPLALEVKSRFESLTGGKLVEGYGLTEASPCTHCNPLDWAKPGSIGLPLPNTESLIVKGEEAETASTGEMGELIVRGPQVMAGYHNRPNETARVVKSGWLFTGDMGYMDEEGYVFLMDRKKEMIISGGCNVYPKEVEDVLFSLQGVLEAAVVGVRDSQMGEKVVAAVVLKPGIKLDEKEVIAHCKRLVASYKAPKKIYFMESLPKTVIGKVLKRVLKEEIEKMSLRLPH